MGLVRRVLVRGNATGDVLRLTEPLSLWGGVDPRTGEIVERNHPQFGEELGGRIVLMPHGRGSSSSSSVLAEILRVNSGPSAIILEEPDPILVIGSLVAEALYGLGCPVVLAPTGSVTEGKWQLINGHLQQSPN